MSWRQTSGRSFSANLHSGPARKASARTGQEPLLVQPKSEWKFLCLRFVFAFRVSCPLGHKLNAVQIIYLIFFVCFSGRESSVAPLSPYAPWQLASRVWAFFHLSLFYAPVNESEQYKTICFSLILTSLFTFFFTLSERAESRLRGTN